MLYYEPFVKPLLEKRGSKYRHTTLIGAHPREYWDNYRQIFEDKDLVGRPALSLDDPKLREIDTSILLTGNLWRKYAIMHKTNYADHSTLLLQHMTWAGLTNDIFQRSGLVRQLWWAPDDTKRSIFPTTIRGKRSYDLGLTMGASITEVAGVSQVESYKRAAAAESPRPLTMDASVLGRVEQKMAEKGLVIPPNRTMPHAVEAIKMEDNVHVTDSIVATTCTTIAELKAAIEKFDAWLVTISAEIGRAKYQSRSTPRVLEQGLTDDRVAELFKEVVRYKQSIDVVDGRRPFDHVFISTLKAYVRVVIIVDLELLMINLEAEYAAVRDTNPDPDALAACRAAIQASSEAVAQLALKNIGDRKRETIRGFIDDVLSVETRPSTLHRDRRPYEPLQAKPEEFWPQYEVTLLDVMPNTRELSAPGIANRREGTKICQELLKYLYHSPSLPITTALDRIAPNAAQDLIPEVPALTDARQGGRLDPGQMSVRFLTSDMVEGIVKAFLEWPFRPSTVEMALAQDGGWARDEDEADGEID